jgi:hypothetical protein
MPPRTHAGQFGSDTDIPAIAEAQIAVITMDDILKYQRIEVSGRGLQNYVPS